MYAIRGESNMLNVLKVLLWRDMTNKEIRKAYQRKFNEVIKSSDVCVYLKRLQKHDLVRVRGKKKGKNIYRSKLRENYLTFNKLISVLKKIDLPNATKRTLYKLILELLPKDLADLMNRVTHQQQGHKLRKEIIEEIKNLYS